MTSRAVLARLCFVPLLVASVSAAPPTATPSAADRSVDQIARERFELATKGYDIAQVRYKQGVAGYDTVVEWLRRKALAANELSDAAKRNQVLQEYVSALKGEVSKAEQSVKAGASSEDELMRLRLNELEGELWLARSKEGDEQPIAVVASTQPARGSGEMANDVRIESALFGSGTRLVDVTDRVVELLRSKPEGFTARADSLGVDPAPGKNKSLLIRYRYQNREGLFMVTGGNKASYRSLTDPKAEN